MSITISADDITVELSPDLYWADEFSWAATAQSVERSVTGALLIQHGQKSGGRPITLIPLHDGAAWMERSVIVQLAEWADIPGKQMQLALRGSTRTVIFRHHEGKAIDAKPVAHWSEMVASDKYTATLNFMEL